MMVGCSEFNVSEYLIRDDFLGLFGRVPGGLGFANDLLFDFALTVDSDDDISVDVDKSIEEYGD